MGIFLGRLQGRVPWRASRAKGDWGGGRDSETQGWNGAVGETAAVSQSRN